MDVARLTIRRSGSEVFAVGFAPPSPACLPGSRCTPCARHLAIWPRCPKQLNAPRGCFRVGAGSLPENLAALGRLLTRCFLPAPIRDALQRLPPEIPVLICTHCADYPWELLHVGADLLFLQRPVGRQLEGPSAVPEPRESIATDPALLLIVNPTGDLDASDSEAEGILNVIDALPYYVRATAIFRTQASPATVLGELASGSYSLIHYSGHADLDESAGGRQALRLSGGLLDAERLGSALLGSPLVFLNVCRSAQPRASHGLAEAVLQAGA